MVFLKTGFKLFLTILYHFDYFVLMNICITFIIASFMCVNYFLVFFYVLRNLIEVLL